MHTWYVGGGWRVERSAYFVLVPGTSVRTEYRVIFNNKPTISTATSVANLRQDALRLIGDRSRVVLIPPAAAVVVALLLLLLHPLTRHLTVRG